MEPGQLEIVLPLLAVIVDPLSYQSQSMWEDEEISDEENAAVARAKMEVGPGTSLADLMIELGLPADELTRLEEFSEHGQSSKA